MAALVPVADASVSVVTSPVTESPVEPVSAVSVSADVEDSGAGSESRKTSGLLAASGSIAIATLMSRITGFFKQVLLLTLLGAGVASSFTVANQIPNMISELVLGAVLTSIVVPVLVRAEREDPDGGAAFVRRLFTMSLTILAVAALFATASASFLVTRFFLDADGEAFVGGVGGGALGDGPAFQHAIELEPEIVVEAGCVVLLHHEAAALGL